MTNLEYLAWFLEDTYGAICFHNEAEDGYVEFPSEENKEMETLAVYFPNEIDLMDQEVAERLTKKAGKEFYKRYKGALGMRACPIMSNYLFVRYSKDGVVLRLCQEPLGWTIMSYDPLVYLTNYFLGTDISLINVKETSFVYMPSNNDFDLGINPNMQIAYDEHIIAKQMYKANPHGDMQAILEDFLTRHNKPLVTKENGFHIEPNGGIFLAGEGKIVYGRENADKVNVAFGGVVYHCQRISQERGAATAKLSVYLSSEERMAFREARGVNFIERERKKRAQSDYDDDES